MSHYQDSWNRADGDRGHNAGIPESFREEYPALSQVLGGVPVGKGETGGVPAATVNIWFEGGELRFCIMPRLGNRVAFGVAPSPEKGLAAIETEVAAGRFGWKPTKNRRTA